MPKVHIICGMCGSNTLLKYRIGIRLNDDTNKEVQTVCIICENCGSLTDLDEVLQEEGPNKKLKEER